MQVNDQRVREFAYHIWESEGRPHGQALRHWEMACKLASSQSKGKTKPQQSASTEPLEPLKSAKTTLSSDSLASISAKEATQPVEAIPAKPAKKSRTLKASPATTPAKTATAKAKAKPKAELQAIPEAEIKKPAKAKKVATKEKQLT